MFCRNTFAAALALLMSSTAIAQPVPSTAPVPTTWRTYSAGVAFTPATTATADFLTITGAANTLVRVTRIECEGTATAAGNPAISVILRNAVPTVAGTSTSPTAVPYDATSDTTAAKAVVRAYTVAPTPGAAVGTMLAKQLFVTPTGTPAQNEDLVINFSTRQAERLGVALRNATSVLALNTTAPAGTAINCSITWTEQP